MLRHSDKTVFEIFGSPDDIKFQSCLTLFEAATETEEDSALFSRALDLFYDGARDERTLSLLRADL